MQLESGEALDDGFRKAAATEIDQFRREIVERSGQQTSADDIDDVQVLREVMNTVGKKGRLGESIRCVVSVSMLTEGWDTNTVTHVLGVRAFGTQLLCEQVIGRGRFDFQNILVKIKILKRPPLITTTIPCQLLKIGIAQNAITAKGLIIFESG